MTQVRIGMLTPSSNTVLEPYTSRMIAEIPNTSVHYSRFEVTEIGLRQKALAQFAHEPMLTAAELLSHAHVDVISWNGTSAGWLGTKTDFELVDAIEARTGTLATTCVLSMLEAFALLDIKSYGLVTPYTEDVQRRIVSELQNMGFACGAEEHFGIRDNFTFGTIEPSRIGEAVRRATAQDVDVVVIFCTNLAGAEIAEEVERECGTTVLDSVALTVWGALRAAGRCTAGLAPWGPALSRLGN